VAVSAIALAIVFRKLNLSDLWEVLGNVHFGWLAVAVAVFAGSFVLAGTRWHLMLRLKACAVHFGVTLRLEFIGHFFNSVLFGPSGGDIAKSGLYCRWYGHPMPEVLAACALDRLLGFGGSVLFGIFGLAAALLADALPDLTGVGITVRSKWIWLGFGMVLFTVGGIALRRRIAGESFVTRTLDSMLAGLRALVSKPWLGAQGLLLGLAVQVGMAMVMALCLRAVSHQPLPWAKLAWTFPMISLVSAMPLTVSGSGFREGASLALLGLYGVPAADAVAAALLTFAMYTVWAGLWALLWWREAKSAGQQTQPSIPSISVVIPTLNEAGALVETVRRLRAGQGLAEILVVDGGSQDTTREVAARLGCTVISAAAGRGGQMRRGAMKANGNVILLLHADTWVPPEWDRAITDCLRDVTVVGGGFWKVFRQPSLLMLGSRLRCGLRLWLGGRIMGDQGIFIRRETLDQIGGVPDLPLLEEFELCRRLRSAGRLALAGATVSTSERRFTKLGVLRTYLRMWRVTLQYQLGVSPVRLRDIYEKD
jgi:rSAM/selenodomain-associated transferase 2